MIESISPIPFQVIHKQKSPAEHCPTLLESLQNSNTLHRNSWSDNVQGEPDNFWIWAQWLVSWEGSINTPPPPTAQKNWPLQFPVKQAHFLHSQRSISLFTRAFISSSCLEIEWSKNLSSLCDSPPQAHLDWWIFILHAYYSLSIAPRRLEVALELMLSMVSRGKVCECLIHLCKERSKH
jgi:hypothetical protein